MEYELKKAELHLVLRPTLSPCHNYDKEKPVTVVLAPVAIEEVNGVLRISWACSLGPWCPFKCRYSRVKQ